VIFAKQHTATTMRYYNLHSFTNATLYKYVVLEHRKTSRETLFRFATSWP